MKRLLIITLFILSLALPVHADFMSDLIVTGTSGIWTDSRAYSTLANCITDVGTTEVDIYIAKQEAVTVLTIPATARLHFLKSGSIANTGQLTLNTKQIFAGDQQIFTGTGDIDFSPGSVVRSSWFPTIVTAFTLTNDDNVTLVISESAFITAICAVGDNVNLKFESPNTRLTANAGFTLSNIKNIEAGNFQLFAGAGTFTFLDGVRLDLSWFARLRSALTWIDTTEATLEFSGTHTIDYTDTVPNNITLKSTRGLLSVSLGQTLTINGAFEAGLYKVFNDTRVTFGLSSIREVHPEWWGWNTIPGTTDMTAEIQAAIDSLTSGDVIFQNTTYLISSALNPESYVNFKGSGTIKLANGSDCNMLDFTTAETDILIEGLTFDGNGLNQARANTVNIIHGNLAIKRLTIKTCTFKNSSFHSFWSEAVGNEDVIIEGCKFYDYDASAIAFQYITGGVIANNLFDNTALTLTAGANAVAVNYGDDIAVTGNRINMSDSASADSFGIEGTNVPSNVTVTGNTVNCNAGTSNGGISLTHTVGDKNSTISGNSIYQPGTIAGIEVGGQNIAITGNTVQGAVAGVSSIAVNGDAANISIVGNTILDYGGTGIDLELSAGSIANVYNFSIIGNTLLDATGTGYHSIYGNASPGRNVTVIGNTIYNNPTGYGIHFITGAAYYLYGAIISNNSIYGVKKGIALVGTTNYNFNITGNNIENYSVSFIESENDGHLVKDNTPNYETMTTASHGDCEDFLDIVYLDSTAGIFDPALRDGRVTGQIKIVKMTVDGGDVTLYVDDHITSDPETFVFNDVGDVGVFMWDGTHWHTIYATATAT